jgi:hypothetical protein
MHTGLDSQYNLSHQVDHGGKQQFPRILYFGGACKQRIDLVGNEDSPQQATGYQKENRLLMRNHGFSNSSL